MGIVGLDFTMKSKLSHRINMSNSRNSLAMVVDHLITAF